MKATKQKIISQNRIEKEKNNLQNKKSMGEKHPKNNKNNRRETIQKRLSELSKYN